MVGLAKKVSIPTQSLPIQFLYMTTLSLLPMAVRSLAVLSIEVNCSLSNLKERISLAILYRGGFAI